MNKVSVRRLAAEDADRLFVFEAENRSYFEAIGLPRSGAYYERASFQKILEKLVAEQEAEMHYLYLARSAQGEVIGRVNLTNVAGEPLRKAELGYRIGEPHQGKGYATAAVKLVLEQARAVHRLHRIEAGTSPENIGSQTVLLKNGFRLIGTYRRDGVPGCGRAGSLLFEKILDIE